MHVDQRVDGEKVNATAHKMAGARLRVVPSGAQIFRKITLSESGERAERSRYY
jgi:hypothetical protein